MITAQKLSRHFSQAFSVAQSSNGATLMVFKTSKTHLDFVAL